MIFLFPGDKKRLKMQKIGIPIAPSGIATETHEYHSGPLQHGAQAVQHLLAPGLVDQVQWGVDVDPLITAQGVYLKGMSVS